MAMQDRRSLLAIAPIAIMISCAGVPPEKTGVDTSEYPSEWSPPVLLKFRDNSCQDIDGKYSSGGESNSDIGERFSNPIFERSFFNQIEIADESNSFEVIVEPEKNGIRFDIFNPENQLVIAGATKTYLRCENGWYVSESFIKGGSGDNPVRSSFVRTAYGKAEDGSLLIHLFSEVVSGKMFIGRETNTSSIWYRYKELK